MSAPQKSESPVAAGQIADQNAVSVSIVRDEKPFCNLRAAFALKGHTLTRTDRADGVVTYFVSRWGMVRHLGSLDEARGFLRMIGGAY